MSSEIPRFERGEIEGIPVYVGRSEGRYGGGLMFRTGRADETFRHGGLSHLVEHLALFGLGSRQPYAFNGYVQGLFTGFVAWGTPEEVAGFLSGVARALRDLPLQRLDDEARVLRTEAMERGGGPVTEFLWLRYGATGHGQHALNELELLAPEPDRVRAWAAERFTAGNAALWFSGPAPSELSLGLPAGPRIPAPPPISVPDARYPAWASWNWGGIGLSFIRPRADWLAIPIGIAAERIATHLRYERGLTYNVATEYHPIQADVGHAAIWSACLAEHAPAVRDGILEVFEDLSAHGPTDKEMETVRQDFLRSCTEPDAVVHAVTSAAFNELIGYRVYEWSELVEELQAMDPPEVARRTGAALDSALLALPQGCSPPARRFLDYPIGSSTVVNGRSFRGAEAIFPWSKGPRLVVGDEGVSLVQGPVAWTVEYGSCAAAVQHADGTLEIFGDDGFRVPVEPGRWRNGAEAVRRVLRWLPPERLVRASSQGGTP